MADDAPAKQKDARIDYICDRVELLIGCKSDTAHKTLKEVRTQTSTAHLLIKTCVVCDEHVHYFPQPEAGDVQ